MKPDFRQLLRQLQQLQLIQQGERLQPPKAFLSQAPLDPEAQQVIEQLCSQGWRSKDNFCLELPLALNEDGIPTPLIERRQGVPCEDEKCRYRYIVATALRNLRGAQRAGEHHAQHAGLLGRYFASLHFNDAFAVDATELRFLDERLLRENSAVAIQHLRAFRDAGVDVVWIKGVRTSRVAVLFIDSVLEGSTEILDEAAYFFRRAEGIWERFGDEPDTNEKSRRQHHFAAPRPKRISHWSTRRLLSFIGWEMLFAFLASLLLAPVLGLIDVQLEVPIWLLLVILLPLGWISGRALFQAIKPYKELLEEASFAFFKLPAALRQFEEDREFFRRTMTKFAEENSSEDDDLDPLP